MQFYIPVEYPAMDYSIKRPYLLFGLDRVVKEAVLHLSIR